MTVDSRAMRLASAAGDDAALDLAACKSSTDSCTSTSSKARVRRTRSARLQRELGDQLGRICFVFCEDLGHLQQFPVLASSARWAPPPVSSDVRGLLQPL